MPRRSYGSRTRSTSRRRTSYGRAQSTRRTTSTRRRAAPRAPQTIKLVIESAPASPVSRPDLPGAFLVEKPSKKAKL